MTELLSLEMQDGTRCFYTLECKLDPYELRHIVGNLSNVKLTGSIDCDKDTVCWFGFDLVEETCVIHNPYPNGTYWLIVDNPQADELMLRHFVRELLEIIESK